MSTRGYRTMLRIESFAKCQGCSLCIVLVPGLRLQTDPCMAYDLLLRVATTVVRKIACTNTWHVSEA